MQFETSRKKEKNIPEKRACSVSANILAQGKIKLEILTEVLKHNTEGVYVRQPTSQSCP